MYSHNDDIRIHKLSKKRTKMDDYMMIKRIGEGAHGYVLHAKCKETSKEVALKKVLVKRKEKGLPNEIIREIKTLQAVDCRYVMKLLDFFSKGSGFILVFDYMPSGLWEMLNDEHIKLSEGQLKTYMQMLLQGVSYLHENRIMHRDLKPANLLIGQDGILRIADFGQARPFLKDGVKCYTPQVSTRWYRAPELLYGSRKYTEALDLWAVGCIVAEAFNKMPLFPGETDIDQLALVIRSLGSPTEENWPGHTKLPDFNKISFKQSPPLPWEKLLPFVNKDTREFIKAFIKYDANKRLTAKQALKHPFFSSDPLPATENEMPIPPYDHRTLVNGNMYENHDEELFEELSRLIDEKF
ncbi:cyclin-dependent kinase 20 [Halyomorpha halys]|uniref:cyclin-dependent kinase 20 n=1 Tax=Halyomorpha halys TaxID=286706 RepID=UPI0006D51305|nr:cyclin-dependent kinase 20 [Halyomorpha halys]